MTILTSQRLSMALALAVACASQTLSAQELVEEVVVVGKSIKASQMAAIEAKRNADNVADIISADAIGRFPDQNLADALGRVPGIAIERDQGQARYVSFRGSPKRYTTTAFNGIDIPGVENGRVPRFDAYPAVITGQVVANKAITANMPGESISGFIDVNTFKPSDIEGWSATAELGIGEQDLGDGLIRRRNARVSYSNDRFGFLVFGSENLREQITDNREMEYTGTQANLVPVELDFRSYFVDRTDEAYGASIEFYLDNGSRIYLDTLATEFTDEEERSQWEFLFPGGAPANTGTLPSVTVRRLMQDGDYLNETDVTTLGGDFSVGEWDLEASVSRIETVFDTYLPIPFLIGSVSNVFYDVTDAQDPVLTFDGTLQDINFPTPLHVNAIGNLETDSNQFKFDATRSNRWGELRFGFKHDDRESEGGGAPLTIAVAGLFNLPVEPYFDGAWETDFNNTIGGYYAPNRAIRAAQEANGQRRPDFPAEELIELEETIMAAYVMQTIDREWGNIIVGVRIEDTDYETRGSRLVGTDFEPLTVSNSYTNVLPSAHVNWDFREDQKLRFSFSTGISRPTYIEARAAASINVLGRTIEGGNPDLEEETSWGVDLAYEWYFDEASILAFTVFHRSIDNVISESNELVPGSIYSDLAAPGELWDLQAFGNGEDGHLQGLEISFSGRLDNYIEGFWSGFGFEANLTLIDSEYTSAEGVKFDLPGQSDTTYNASVFYENYGLSARLSYRYRDQWLDETEAGQVGLPVAVLWDEQERLDLSVRYDLEALTGYQAQIFLDVNNLTDETDVRFTGNSWNPNQVEAYGRRYTFGLRFSI